MRYIMKGGVWKNSEDQILKAAIMKYGLNQWSRISSLLQRKSAKQCKQRWYQWLDPSIKKTQWSRAEDQKLLQLARVFPSQWRTIAPFVGRTPTQCFQRYEKLLDLAQGKTGTQTEDLKRLRPGEIDPNPQTKPARLDPIDMDEDEKEMLAQVRVRLANTKGKKAKRKEREKIIQQARRLAQLQKIRQLEMAGVDNIPTQKQIKRMRQKQDIDYNKEIPFKRQIPQFVYKVEESETSKNTFFASTISLQTLEGKRRDVEQQLQRKLDKKRLKKLKDTDYKAMMALKSRFDKPTSVPIQLPEPQLNEKDLQDIKKYNITTPLNSIIHNPSPFGMTPENKIMLSARVNFSLNHKDMMTPVGQDREQEEVDGVQGLNYLKQMQKKERDPNRMRSVDRIISERAKTPSAGNDWEHDKKKVQGLFKNLRRPQNIIEFEIPQEQQQAQQENEQIMDAQQLQQLEAQKIQQQQQEKLKLRNKALKQNLERAKHIPQKFTPAQTHNEIEKLIEKQMLNMIYSDAIDYPIQQFTLPEQKNLTYVTPLSLKKRNLALQLIQQEFELLKYEKKIYEKQYEEDHYYIKRDSKKKEVLISNKKLSEDQYYKQSFIKLFSNLTSYVIDILKQKQLQKKNQILEKKVKKYLGGYEKIISNKIGDINTLQQQLTNLKMQRKTLQILEQQENASATKRLEIEEQYYKIIYNSI